MIPRIMAALLESLELDAAAAERLARDLANHVHRYKAGRPQRVSEYFDAMRKLAIALAIVERRMDNGQTRAALLPLALWPIAWRHEGIPEDFTLARFFRDLRAFKTWSEKRRAWAASRPRSSGRPVDRHYNRFVRGVLRAARQHGLRLRPEANGAAAKVLRIAAAEAAAPLPGDDKGRGIRRLLDEHISALTHRRST